MEKMYFLFPLLLCPNWKVDVMPGTPAAILDPKKTMEMEATSGGTRYRESHSSHTSHSRLLEHEREIEFCFVKLR